MNSNETKQTSAPKTLAGFKVLENDKVKVWVNLCQFEGNRPQVQMTITDKTSQDAKGKNTYVDIDHDYVDRIEALLNAKKEIICGWMFRGEAKE